MSPYSKNAKINFSEMSNLVGKTLTKFVGSAGDAEIRLFFSDGSIYVMTHAQDCCESVYIESIVGSVADLIGSPILVSSESTNGDDPEDYVNNEYRESYTWTFYKLATVKGWVDIRWLGESNGQYSESVDLVCALSGS